MVVVSLLQFVGQIGGCGTTDTIKHKGEYLELNSLRDRQ